MSSLRDRPPDQRPAQRPDPHADAHVNSHSVSLTDAIAQPLRYSLLWPFTLTPALFMLFAGSVLAVARQLLIQVGGYALAPAMIMIIIVSIGIARYLFLVLRKLALGHTEVPPIGPEHFNLVEDPRFSVVLLWLFLLVVAGFFSDPLTVQMVIVLSALLMPAVLIMVATTGRIAASLHPQRIAGFVRRAGRIYLVMVAASALFASAAAASLALEWAFVSEILGLYLLFVLFSLLGRMAWQQRLRLDFAVEKAPEIDARRARLEMDKKIQRVLDRVYPLSAAHEYQRALRELADAQSEMVKGEVAEQMISERLLAWENPELGLLYLQVMVSRALQQSNIDVAWQHCLSGLSVSNRFHPASGSEAVLLARYGSEAGQQRQAVKLIMHFEKHYPQLPELLPVAAVIEARVLAEKAGRPEVALARLQLLAKTSPECKGSAEFNAYLSVLELASQD